MNRYDGMANSDRNWFYVPFCTTGIFHESDRRNPLYSRSHGQFRKLIEKRDRSLLRPVSEVFPQSSTPWSNHVLCHADGHISAGKRYETGSRALLRFCNRNLRDDLSVSQVSRKFRRKYLPSPPRRGVGGEVKNGEGIRGFPPFNR